MSWQFTPGPWVLNLVQRWPFGVEVVSETGRFILREPATCHSTVQKTRADNEAGMGFKKESGEAAAAIAEQDANARLMASAPMLLEEFQNANVQMDMAAECIEAGRYDEALLHVRAMKRKRTAIIAAATGETE